MVGEYQTSSIFGEKAKFFLPEAYHLALMRIFSNLFIAYICTLHINRKDANGDNDYVDDNDV